MAANAAIYFHTEGYTTDQPRLMGRQAAGEGFLAGMLQHARIDELVCFTEHPRQFRQFERLCAGSGLAHAGLPRRWASPGRPAPLQRAGTLHLPGPNLAEVAWSRRRRGSRAWSITGVTHTTASQGFMDGIGALLTGPVEPWDALICTSRSVLRTVQLLLDGLEDWLGQRLGAARFPRPALPVIPLGVDCAALDPPPPARAAARRAWRERLGIGAHDLVVLYVGRLSWHAKASPYPMYAGLQQAIARLGGSRPVHLIESGWHANDWIRDGFVEAQQALAPGLRCHLVDGREAAARREIWHAADIFCSLSDNIQETFGLTPVEAMAAGLPVVASDWDGYRETLVHGETALLVPTTLPGAAAGQLLADRHALGIDDYDHYCAQAALITAIDTGAVAEAMTCLLGDGERRRAMGEAGRARARALYDWQVVIAAYQELWAELGRIRGHAAGTAPPGQGNPWRGNPLELFAHYPTRQLDEAARLHAAATPPADRAQLERLRIARMSGHPVDPSPLTWEILALVEGAGARGLSLGELLAALPDRGTRLHARHLVGWLMKMGLVE